jgi:hypothetical protein
MSEVDLDLLDKVCADAGMELVRNQKTYRWYGTYIGGPLPEGFTTADLGKCEHAIRVKGADKHVHEVGVCNRNGKTNFLWDDWQKGFGLMDKIGADCRNIIQGYRNREFKANAKHMGLALVKEEVTAQGQLVLHFR